MSLVKSAVSVVIPAYNSVSFVGEAIESALSQSLKPLEILVIDDGSNDETADLVRKYPPPVLLLRQENRGVSAARNLGVAQAKGEFIAFLDADDVFIEHRKIERQLRHLVEKNYNVILTGWRVTDAQLNKISDRKVWLEVPYLNLYNLLRAPAVLPSTMLIRRENLLAVNGFDENITNSEDVDLVFRLALTGCRFAWLPEITVAYRQHAANATRKVRQQADGINYVLDKLFSSCDLPPEVRFKERDIRRRNLIWSAFYCLAAGDLTGMKRYLLDSRQFSDYINGETLLVNWFYVFSECARERSDFDQIANRLLSSKEWSELEEVLIS